MSLHFNRIFHYKSSILGYPWVPPFMETSISMPMRATAFLWLFDLAAGLVEDRGWTECWRGQPISAKGGTDLRRATVRFRRTGKRTPWRMGFDECVGWTWLKRPAVVTARNAQGPLDAEQFCAALLPLVQSPEEISSDDGFKMAEATVILIKGGTSSWTTLLAFYFIFRYLWSYNCYIWSVPHCIYTYINMGLYQIISENT